MKDNAKVFSLIEMREMMIDTSDYQMMEEVGEFTGTLEMKAQGHKKSIRIFLTLDDGRKIITPIFWWQTYLGLCPPRKNRQKTQAKKRMKRMTSMI